MEALFDDLDAQLVGSPGSKVRDSGGGGRVKVLKAQSGVEKHNYLLYMYIIYVLYIFKNGQNHFQGIWEHFSVAPPSISARCL